MSEQTLVEEAYAAYEKTKQAAEVKKERDIDSHTFTEETARKKLSDVLERDVTSPFKLHLGNYRWYPLQAGGANISWDPLEWHTYVEGLHFIVQIEKKDLGYAALETSYRVTVKIFNEVYWIYSLTCLGEAISKAYNIK